MSYEAMTWAVKIIEQNKTWKTPLRFVLLIMANRADEEGVLYPSVRWIMERTALAESTVRQATRDLQQLGLLIKEPRRRDLGGQTSNEYRLAMSQFVLRLEPTPGPSHGGGRVHGTGGAVHTVDRAPPSDGPQETKEEKKQKKRTGGGGTTPTPVATCFAAYREGMQRRYNAEPASNATSNGQLAHIVGKLGAEAALRVVNAYVADDNPFYVKVRHPLNVLVKDCDRIWIDLQAASAGAPIGTKPWWEVPRQVEERAQRLGMTWEGPNRESYPDFAQRVRKASEEGVPA